MTDENPLLEQLLPAEEIANLQRIPRSSVFQERIAHSNLMKVKAVAELEKKFPGNAVALYLAALYHIDFSLAQNLQFIPEHLSQVEDLQSKILANLALCYFHAGNFFLARRSADLAEPLSKTAELSAKIRYRRALALNSLTDFDGAAKSAEDALKLQPQDVKVRELLREISINRDEAQKKADDLFRGKLVTAVTPVEKSFYCCRRRKID